ncbi:MAG TPA: DUF4267 domain-containing protein [Pyrinomonadaceae bacterium]|nr:DUF4267 domain-containing protein [Pyrinomonadaceae bacterium]
MKKVLGNVGVGFAVVLTVAFVFFGIRGIYDPTAASMRFGLPAYDAAEMFYYRVYLARNIVIVVTGLVLLVLRQWKSVAILLTVVLALPTFDAVLLYRERGPEAGLTIHIVTGVIVAIAAFLMWMKVSSSRTET